MIKAKYSEFVDNIDIDAFEREIDWEPKETKGENDVGFCPFPENHKSGDSTGKFAIHRGKKLYNCWVCGGGSLLSLTMELLDMEMEEATEWLWNLTHGDSRSDNEFVGHFKELISDTKHRVETMPFFNERVLDKYGDAHEWAEERGIHPVVADYYKLKYGNPVMRPAPIKEKGGERVKIDNDYYGPAIIIPHYWKDRLVGWQSRWLEYPNTPKWLAKYTNTRDFPKSYTLFNYNEAMLDPKPIIVCESVPTVLVLTSLGYPAVSFFGSKPTEPHLRLLRKAQQGIIFAPDNDKPGVEAMWKATEYLIKYIPVKHLDKVELGIGADLGDLYQQEGSDAVKDHINRAFTPETLAIL